VARDREDAVIGCLLGTAVGDALGLCCEGLSRRRQRRLFPDLDGYHLVFGRGMTSDDTEHTCMVAQALIVSAGEEPAFLKSLAWRLRFWLLGLPAGIGKATLRACVKLWLGFSGRRSGVFSAGNGPAMRSALLGICYGHDPARLRTLVRACTRITHTDPKAEWGAYAVALAAHRAGRGPAIDCPPGAYLEALGRGLGPEASALLELVARAVNSAAAGETTEAFADSLGLSRGVSGYVLHTVPVVLQAWFRHPDDFRGGLLEIIRCGGDTDTTAAILGAILGARVGRAGVPPEWLDGLCEWPRTERWLERLGKRLAEVAARGVRQRAVSLPVYGLVLRNLFFLAVVLCHGFRRLLPPY
jgi:ADP-ribosylglycohydrolase